MRLDCVERRFAQLFSNYIRLVVIQPVPFILLPILITAVLSVGLLRHSDAFVKDELELYTPTDARARDELRLLDRLFHINDTDPFYATRRYDIKRAGYIIVTSEHENGDILNPLVMQAAMQLWSVIQSLTIEDSDAKRVNYPSICVKFPMPPEFGHAISAFLAPNITSPQQICVSNPLVEVFKFLFLPEHAFLNRSLDEITLGQISDAFTFEANGMTHLLGGISFDSSKRISGAKAMMLPYALRHATKAEDELAEKWELKLADFLLTYDSPVIRTSWWTYETLASESARDRQQLINMLGPCFIVVSVYTILSCCVLSWVRSRPLLAVGGVLSAAMAIVSGVGLLLLAGFNMTSVAYSMPFIVFSVGVDNVFILLSAWRSTSYELSLMERMRETFGDAAVSITVTSLTDLISFGVGCLTPFPSVQMFCAYAVVAVIFTYVYQLTFFAGIMVLTCRREIEGRHCLTFHMIKKDPPAKISNRKTDSTVPPSKFWSADFYAIAKKTKRIDKSFEKNHYLARFFRTTYADILLNPLVRMIIICAFLFYLIVATYGCINIKLGLEPNDLLPDNSYGKKTLEIVERYFSDYGSYLHVWMYNLSKVDLGHRRLWIVLEREIELYEHTEFTGYSDSWLRTFLEYVNKAGLYITEENFIYILQHVFLTQPAFTKYNRDVVFDSTGTMLEASRVPVRLRFVGFSNQSRAMHLFRRLAETSDLPTGVYADFFQFAEQYNAVLPGTLSSIAIAGAAVVLVSLVFIPVPAASLWVSFSIVSINIGILGFMTFWSVRLDFISMVTIVMSIGFCVDFAAHLAYNFAKGVNLSSSERMRNALYSVGTPILQSASSTILGVSFMASTESYVFRSFLKTIILVIVLGALHGLIILPVLLTMFHCGEEECESEETSKPIGMNDDMPSSIHCHEPLKNRLPRLAINEPPPAYKKHPSTTSSEYETHNAVNNYLESTLDAARSKPVVGFPYRISPEKCRQNRDKNVRKEDDLVGYHKHYKEPNLGRPPPPPSNKISEYESIELHHKRKPKELIYHNPNMAK
uniref:SSD domain-containing protein n=1 Tax=Acrobeloides nanus TaxID=290746 RepID=A0A914D0N6_9BILA